jgi:hypothetical protein
MKDADEEEEEEEEVSSELDPEGSLIFYTYHRITDSYAMA